MEIIKNIKVPTGNITIVQGEKGRLECLSLGDYGRTANVKAQFLGLNKDIAGVPNGECMPLEDKWVITISTQYGCNSGCTFCDVPKVGKGINATYEDIKGQIECALSLHPEVAATKRLNIHYARMGEPSWNPEVLRTTYDLHKIVRPFVGNSLIHPVFTAMPRSQPLGYTSSSGMSRRIVDVNIIVPNKVAEVKFLDGDKQKVVCQEPDTFSLEQAISICLTKHLLGGTSAYNKAIKNGIKVYEDRQKMKCDAKAEEDRVAKRQAKKAAT